MAGIKEEKKIYLVGIYCRLSKDDGTDNESASIATQKSILTDYVKKQGWHIAKTYVDDGYSGTNFQRPSFQNMIKDIESGLINCVITKDLSRLGRNYLDCGLYLEVFFPEHNVRYIAVNDGVDTLNKSAMDITPFRNILNEMYAADISVKIKSAYRARFQQGKFMGTTAPYGYIKDPADHNHLLIDDKVAHVVKEIFDLALKGNGVAKICRHLNKQHILRPAAYAAERGETGFERHFEGNEDKRYIWSGNSVRSILRSPIYAGNLVGYKRIAANMKIGMYAGNSGNTLYCPTGYLELLRLQDRFVYLPEMPYRKVDLDKAKRNVLTQEEFTEAGGKGNVAGWLNTITVENVHPNTTVAIRMKGIAGKADTFTLYAYDKENKLKEVPAELWHIQEEDGTLPDKLTEDTLYEVHVMVEDGGEFDLSDTEKEIKIAVILGNK